MKIKNRVIALVMSLVTMFSLVSVPASALKIADKNVNLSGSLLDTEYPMPDIGDVIISIGKIDAFMFHLTGSPMFSEEKFNIVVDDTIQGILDYIFETCGVDFGKIFHNMPQTNQQAEWIIQKFNIDIEALQTEMNKAAAEQREQGNELGCFVIRWVSVWLGVIDECYIHTVPVEDMEGMLRFDIGITYRDGRKDVMYSGIYYDTVNNRIVNKDGGPAVLGFIYDGNNCMTYTDVNSWQRKFGFTMVYDIFCYVNSWFIQYNTQRIKFVYDDREWMIQIWKGRYLITNGGEVGVYTRPIGSKGTFYRCAEDEDMMYMSLDVYHGDTHILHREPTLHWWITGFAVSSKTYLPSTLTLASTITFKDEEMRDLFTAALDEKAGIITYDVDGLSVSLVW